MNTITIENKNGKVKLNEAVTQDSIKRMIDEIGKLFGAKASADGADFGEIMNCAENAVDVLELEINSPGGSVFDGYTVYQEIKSLQDRGVTVNAVITGMAASMASVICMACDKVAIVPHGRMMIHDASSGVHGNAASLRRTADLLEGISDDIANIYSNRTGIDKDEIREMMKRETWMNAKESIANGFVDEVISAQVDFRQASAESEPMTFLNRLTNPSSDEANERITALESDIKAQADEYEAKLVAAESALQDAANIAAENAELKLKVEAIAGFEAKITELESKVIELETANAITAEKVDTAAAQKLASMGHGEPLNLGASTPSNTTISAYDEYRQLQKTDPRAAAKFWDENEAKIKSH